jgi:membrane fusion protein, multidrug efflux system
MADTGREVGVHQRRNLIDRPGLNALRGLAGLLAAILLTGCGDKADRQEPAALAPPPTVTVISTQLSDVTAAYGFNGRVVAEDTVELRARVAGFLQQRLFKEGADVKVGELLFVIEKDHYQAVVEQRQAELASDEANRANTAVALRRGEELVKNKNIPQAEVDQRRANDEMAAAQILEGQAALKQAEINLGYTDITAPIAGRIGRASVSVGNLVGPDSGVLATIVSQDPIYVTFPVSQRELLEYKREQGGSGHPPVVRVGLPDDTLYKHPGSLNFLDIQVDPGTDTVTVRAVVPNPDRVLVDGEFVSVTVEAGTPERQITVPQAALQVDQAGPYVLVVDGDDKVEARRVKLGQTEGTQTVIQDGLKEGERVIVEGIQKVRPGMVVAATEAPPAPAAEPKAGAPTAPSGQEAEAPAAPAGQEAQAPAAPAGKEAEAPAAPAGQEAQAPAAPTGKEAEAPAAPPEPATGTPTEGAKP